VEFVLSMMELLMMPGDCCIFGWWSSDGVVGCDRERWGLSGDDSLLVNVGDTVGLSGECKVLCWRDSDCVSEQSFWWAMSLSCPDSL